MKMKKLPKKWSKIDDLLLIPADHKINTDSLEELAIEYGVKRIARQWPILPDQIRSPGVQLIYGDNTELIQRENGISYSYDLTKSMFSRGNISEKIRFSKFNVHNEIIVDCFAGIGYWVLQLSKSKPPLKVYCIDLNPNQLISLERNIKLNKRDQSRFELIEGDCTKVNIPAVVCNLNM